MINKTILSTDEFSQFIDQLSLKSINHYYNPYRLFVWPESLPEEAYWMSLDLLSIYGTSLMEELNERDLQRLSKWESINFYSLNVHGIRELLIEVVNRIHMIGFELMSGFFHHFIGEENEHMWFFSEFCRRYAGKIYSSPSLKILNQDSGQDKDIENFLVFSRIVIFEELVDFYNVRMANDETLHHSIRELNRVHHKDEARHIAFGRRLILFLYQKLADKLSTDRLKELENYLKRFIIYSLRSFYNPYVYKDAGINDPLGFRARLIGSEERRKLERRTINKTVSFFIKSQIFTDDSLSEMMSL